MSLHYRATQSQAFGNWVMQNKTASPSDCFRAARFFGLASEDREAGQLKFQDGSSSPTPPQMKDKKDVKGAPRVSK